MSDVLFDVIADGGFVFGRLAGIGHILRQNQLCLLAIVERAAELFLAAPGHAESALQVIKVLLTDGQRGTRQDDCVRLIEKLVAEQRSHFDRTRDKFRCRSATVHRLNPVDAVLFALMEPGFCRGRKDLASLGGGLQFDFLFFFVEVLCAVCDVTAEFVQFLRQRISHVDRLLDPPVGRSPVFPPEPERAEEVFRRRSNPHDFFLTLRQTMCDQNSLVGAIVVEPVEKVIDLPAGERNPKVITGDSLNGVCLVENHHVVVRQDRRPLASQCEVRKEQRMVHDQDVGIPDTTPGPEIKTLLVKIAVLAQAVSVLALNLVPDRAVGPKIKIRSRAVTAVLRPVDDRLELSQIFRSRIQRARSIIRAEHPPQADVVGAAFDEDCRELDRQNRIQKRNIAFVKLLLQADRVCRNDDAFLLRVFRSLFVGVGCRSENRRHKISKTLPDARTRLDDEMLLLVDRLSNRFGHTELFGTAFVAVESSCDKTVIAEN